MFKHFELKVLLSLSRIGFVTLDDRLDPPYMALEREKVSVLVIFCRSISQTCSPVTFWPPSFRQISPATEFVRFSSAKLDSFWSSSSMTKCGLCVAAMETRASNPARHFAREVAIERSFEMMARIKRETSETECSFTMSVRKSTAPLPACSSASLIASKFGLFMRGQGQGQSTAIVNMNILKWHC